MFILMLMTAGAACAAAEAPRLMLWAWERPEDLRFVNPRTTGVAYLAKTLYLKEGRVIARPRLQPLRIPPNTYVTAVFRIESDASAHNTVQSAAAAAAILALAEKKEVAALQLDFDAAVSERPFYAALISEVRRKSPPQKPLSVTALASWCLGDRWMSDLPVAEAVPMLFRMGPDGPQILRNLARGADFSETLCRGSMGISTDEPAAPMLPGRRVYAFHPKPWTADAVRRLITALESRNSP